MRLGRILTAGLLAAALVSCATPPPTPLPAAPVPVGPRVGLQVTAVPLNPQNPAQDRIGDFVYAGGVAITSPDTSRLHGLSDLKILPDGAVVSVSDDGDFFEAKLQLDAAGRFIGLTDGKVWPVVGLDGKPLQSKEHADAEGLAILPNGDRLVSFERDHRIWLYPKDGSPPRVAPKPDNLFSENEGMEGLTQYPTAGPDAYLVGSEEGEMWLCRLSSKCAPIPSQLGPDSAYGLVAIAPFQDGAIAVLHRAWDPVRGARLKVSFIVDPLTRPRTFTSFVIEGPLTRDNFEGLALVTGPTGGTRLYVLSDDNFSAGQRTLMMAFDWTPRK